MCMDRVDTDVAPASVMAFLATSGQRAPPRQDAEFVPVHSCSRCWASLLPCFATERRAHVNGFLSAKTHISGVQAFAGVIPIEIPPSRCGDHVRFYIALTLPPCVFRGS